MDDIPIETLKEKGKTSKARASVSAEAFGDYNQKSDFKPPKHDKPAAVRTQLEDKLGKSFMFSTLNPQESQIVIDAMQQVKKSAGESVIKEGEDGEELFMIESGTLECTKVFKGNTEPTHLKNYEPGDVFGELALLYNAPRAATITAKTNAELWSLDRATFNAIVKDAAAAKRNKYE